MLLRDWQPSMVMQAPLIQLARGEASEEAIMHLAAPVRAVAS